MKIKKNIFHLSVIILILLTGQSFLLACPRCNQEFYDELLGKRANTLGGQELLEAIRNQTIPGQPSSFTLPSALNDQTDIQQSDTSDTSESSATVEKNTVDPESTTGQFPVISIIAKLLFFGQLFT